MDDSQRPFAIQAHVHAWFRRVWHIQPMQQALRTIAGIHGTGACRTALCPESSHSRDSAGSTVVLQNQAGCVNRVIAGQRFPADFETTGHFCLLFTSSNTAFQLSYLFVIERPLAAFICAPLPGQGNAFALPPRTKVSSASNCGRWVSLPEALSVKTLSTLTLSNCLSGFWSKLLTRT